MIVVGTSVGQETKRTSVERSCSDETFARLRLMQDQLDLQRAQLVELQKKVVDLSKQASAPHGQKKQFGLFSNPFRSRVSQHLTGPALFVVDA